MTLAGLKTYILMVLTWIFSAIAVSNGWIGNDTAAQLVAGSGLAAAIRSALATEIGKVLASAIRLAVQAELQAVQKAAEDAGAETKKIVKSVVPVLLIPLALAFGGCCTHPDVSVEIHQTRLVFQHYRQNVTPLPTLKEEERAKVDTEGKRLDATLEKIEGMLK